MIGDVDFSKTFEFVAKTQYRDGSVSALDSYKLGASFDNCENMIHSAPLHQYEKQRNTLNAVQFWRQFTSKFFDCEKTMENEFFWWI